MQPLTTGEIQFLSPAGESVASYGRAIVEDGCGEQLVAGMTLTRHRLRLVVPREWLERACFPVAVDPLIGPNFAVSTQPIAGNQERSAVAYAGEGACVVAWHGPGNGSDVFAQALSSEGMLLGGTIPLDTRGGDQQYPDAAGNVSQGEALVLWQGYSTLGAADVNIYGLQRGGGCYLVVWGEGTSPANVWGCFVVPTGGAPTPFAIAATVVDERAPDVAHISNRKGTPQL